TSVGPHVLKRDALVRRRRIARFLRRLIDLSLRVGLDLRERIFRYAGVEEPLAVTGDRVLAEPLLDLLVRPVLAGIGPRVAAVAGGLGLDQARSAAAPRDIERAHRGLVDDVDIVAVDQDRLEPVRARAVRGWVLDRRDLVNRRVLHVAVVLADEDDG